MILLLLITLAQAADVYEFCSIKRQTWNERYQRFYTNSTDTFYSYEKPRIIMYEDFFELDRDPRPIIETTTKDGMTCWREHKNSELCYNKEYGIFLWEWNTRAGKTHRNVMQICGINGR